MVEPRAVDGRLDVLAEPQVANHGLNENFKKSVIWIKDKILYIYVGGRCGDADASGSSHDQTDAPGRVDNDGRRHGR